MKEFEYQGTFYKSIKDFCTRNHVSYSKMSRLCRHFNEFRKNPALAAHIVINNLPFDREKAGANDLYRHYIDNAILRGVKRQEQEELESRLRCMTAETGQIF